MALDAGDDSGRLADGDRDRARVAILGRPEMAWLPALAEIRLTRAFEVNRSLQEGTRKAFTDSERAGWVDARAAAAEHFPNHRAFRLYRPDCANPVSGSGMLGTMDIEAGQVWEVYSARDKRWERAVVTKVDGARATLRYEGLLEFLTVDLSEMQSNPEHYRRAPELDPPP